MFEPDKEEINKKLDNLYILQNNIVKSCQNLRDFTQKIKEKKLKTMVQRNKKRKTSM